MTGGERWQLKRTMIVSGDGCFQLGGGEEQPGGVKMANVKVTQRFC